MYFTDSHRFLYKTTSSIWKWQRQKNDETPIDLKLNRTVTLCKWHWWTLNRIAIHTMYTYTHPHCVVIRRLVLMVFSFYQFYLPLAILHCWHNLYVCVYFYLKLQASNPLVCQLLLIKFTQFELISVYAFRSWLIYTVAKTEYCGAVSIW